MGFILHLVLIVLAVTHTNFDARKVCIAPNMAWLECDNP
jgi:hypothetical protein